MRDVVCRCVNAKVLLLPVVRDVRNIVEVNANDLAILRDDSLDEPADHWAIAVFSLLLHDAKFDSLVAVGVGCVFAPESLDDPFNAQLGADNEDLFIHLERLVSLLHLL